MSQTKPLLNDKTLKQNQQLTHSEMLKVSSHTQRSEKEWVVNTVMIENCDTPFVYKRKQEYQSLKGARVNMSYYADVKNIGGIEFDVFNVVKIRRS